jgi:hypothetical protein
LGMLWLSWGSGGSVGDVVAQLGCGCLIQSSFLTFRLSCINNHWRTNFSNNFLQIRRWMRNWKLIKFVSGYSSGQKLFGSTTTFLRHAVDKFIHMHIHVGSSDFGTLAYFKQIWIAVKILRSNYKIRFSLYLAISCENGIFGSKKSKELTV